MCMCGSAYKSSSVCSKYYGTYIIKGFFYSLQIRDPLMSDSVKFHVSSSFSRYYHFQITIAIPQESFREQCVWIDSIVIKALSIWIEKILKMRCMSYLFLLLSLLLALSTVFCSSFSFFLIFWILSILSPHLHLDLKSANLLLDDSFHVKVCAAPRSL